MAEEEVDKILLKVDANGSGEIDYSGIISYIKAFRVDCSYNKQR